MHYKILSYNKFQSTTYPKVKIATLVLAKSKDCNGNESLS